MGAEVLFEAISRSHELHLSNLSSYKEKQNTYRIWEMYEYYEQMQNGNAMITILETLLELGETQALDYLIRLAEATAQMQCEVTLSIIDHIMCIIRSPKAPVYASNYIVKRARSIRRNLLKFSRKTNNALLEAELLFRIHFNHIEHISDEIKILIQNALERGQYFLGENDITQLMYALEMPTEEIEKAQAMIDASFPEDKSEEDDESEDREEQNID